jgi:putative nucleotidyltransferase with HDIG domain
LNETLVNDVSRIWSTEHARALIAQATSRNPKFKSPAAQQISSLVQDMLPPNLKLNTELTERRVNAALGRKETSAVFLKKDQVLLRMGERVSQTQVDILEALRELSSVTRVAKRFGLIACILCLFLLVLVHLDLSRRSFLRLSLKNTLVFSLILVTTLLGVKIVFPYMQLFLHTLSLRIGAEYWMPVGAGAVLVQLLLGRELAFTFALLSSISGGWMMEGSLHFAIWVFAVSAVSVQQLGPCKTRNDLYKSGTWSGLVGALLVAVLDVHQSLGYLHFEWIATIVHCIGAFLSGLLGSIIASTLIPVLESALGYTTNLKLLELSNFNHPLLHNLMMKAPGTYHHSIMVGSLAEIAADRIKANSLLARVSAYYHDIGKMANPLYFIENQSPQYNPHDHLSPAISARILFSHVLASM